MAQATIGLSNVYIDMGGTGQPGNRVPPAMLDGYEFQDDALTAANLTDDEKVIALYNDADTDSIDIYYVDGDLIDIDDPSNVYVGLGYFKAVNNTGDANMQNFIVISDQRSVFVLAHEILHILLNTGHPRTPAEPGTALFNPLLSATNVVGGTKRIGPFPGDGPGSNDTSTIRANAENLP